MNYNPAPTLIFMLPLVLIIIGLNIFLLKKNYYPGLVGKTFGIFTIIYSLIILLTEIFAVNLIIPTDILTFFWFGTWIISIFVPIKSKVQSKNRIIDGFISLGIFLLITGIMLVSIGTIVTIYVSKTL